MADDSKKKGRTEVTDDREVARSIRLPQRIWNLVDREAARCRRSSTKQVDAILSAYYGVDNLELDAEGVAAARTLASAAPSRDSRARVSARTERKK